MLIGTKSLRNAGKGIKKQVFRMKNRKKQRRMKKEGRDLPNYSEIRAEVLRKRKEKRRNLQKSL